MCDEILDIDEFDEDEDVKYHLTPWGCLCQVLKDYNVDISHLTSKMGQHMVDDYMEALCRQGYLSKDDEP